VLTPCVSPKLESVGKSKRMVNAALAGPSRRISASGIDHPDFDRVVSYYLSGYKSQSTRPRHHRHSDLGGIIINGDSTQRVVRDNILTVRVCPGCVGMRLYAPLS